MIRWNVHLCPLRRLKRVKNWSRDIYKPQFNCITQIETSLRQLSFPRQLPKWISMKSQKLLKKHIHLLMKRLRKRKCRATKSISLKMQIRYKLILSLISKRYERDTRKYTANCAHETSIWKRCDPDHIT